MPEKREESSDFTLRLVPHRARRRRNCRRLVPKKEGETTTLFLPLPALFLSAKTRGTAEERATQQGVATANIIINSPLPFS